jgi:hypothetical protein
MTKPAFSVRKEQRHHFDVEQRDDAIQELAKIMTDDPTLPQAFLSSGDFLVLASRDAESTDFEIYDCTIERTGSSYDQKEETHLCRACRQCSCRA